MNSLARRITAASVFALIYASGAALAYARGVRIFIFHFCFAALSAWAFLEVSGVLDDRRERASLTHRLVKWPAFVLAVCLTAAGVLRWAGWPDWYRPVALPALAALAVLAGGIGGLLSLWMRR